MPVCGAAFLDYFQWLPGQLHSKPTNQLSLSDVVSQQPRLHVANASGRVFTATAVDTITRTRGGDEDLTLCVSPTSVACEAFSFAPSGECQGSCESP
jgi:hypothetical protein